MDDTEELLSQIESIQEDLFNCGFDSNGYFPAENRDKLKIISEYTNKMAEFVKQKITEELYNVGNCAVDCGSTEVMDYVDYRLNQLNGKSYNG